MRLVEAGINRANVQYQVPIAAKAAILQALRPFCHFIAAACLLFFGAVAVI
jgi:hypothetical protein